MYNKIKKNVKKIKKKDGETALYAAAAHGHESVAALLIAARCNVDLATEVYIYIYICNIKKPQPPPSLSLSLPFPPPSPHADTRVCRWVAWLEIFLFFSCLFMKIFFLI
jgi:hypothetical protein